MVKIEVDMKLWIDICQTIGYTLGICEGLLGNGTTENAKDCLESCADRLRNTAEKLDEVFND